MPNPKPPKPPKPWKTRTTWRVMYLSYAENIWRMIDVAFSEQQARERANQLHKVYPATRVKVVQVRETILEPKPKKTTNRKRGRK